MERTGRNMGTVYVEGAMGCGMNSSSISCYQPVRFPCKSFLLHMGGVRKPLFTFYIKPEHVRSKMSAFLWSRKIRESTAKGPAKGYYNVCQHICFCYRRQMKFLWVFLGPRKTAKGPRKARREGGFEVKEYWTTPIWMP